MLVDAVEHGVAGRGHHRPEGDARGGAGRERAGTLDERSLDAFGRIIDDEPYQAQVSPKFHPWRRNMTFLPCTATPIRPLLSRLQFIADPQRWGYKFRFGVFRIEQADFDLIRSVMTRPLAA